MNITDISILNNGTIGNSTIVENLINSTSNIYLPSMIFYFIFQFLLTMLVGTIFIREDKANFWAVFIFTQLIGVIILFFIFIFPIIPQILDKIGFVI